MTRVGVLRHFLARVSQASASISEAEQRRILLNRPWEEEFLHWALDGDGPHLHGRFVPLSRRSRSVTSSGWCPGLRREQPE